MLLCSSTPVIINSSLFLLITFPCVGPLWIYCRARAFASRIIYYICVLCMCWCVYSVMYIFVRSTPTFESFCLPSSRHWKWPFLSSDRILLKNLSRRKLGVVNTFAIQGNYKRRSFYCFPSYPLLLLLALVLPSF